MKKLVSALLIFSMIMCMAGCAKSENKVESTENATETEEYRSETAAVTEAIAPTEVPTEDMTEAPTETPTEPSGPDSFCTVLAVGDMLMTKGISLLGYRADGTRNYDWLFEPILGDVANADIAVLNNEVIFGGNNLEASGFPDFNTFTELGDSEAWAGFDVVLSASNHSMDMGEAGIINTLTFWRTYYPYMVVAGIHDSQADQDTLKIIEKNGIRIAIYNCTLHLNSHNLPDGEGWMVDLMNEWNLDRMANYLDRAEAEADITIVFPHWGTEYELKHNATQEYYATFFAEHGADLIIGTHPHCLQDIGWVTAANGRSALCFYSIGNYVSLQDKTLSMVEGELNVVIAKEGNDAYVYDYNLNFLVNYYDSSYQQVRVYPLSEFTADLAASHGINTNGLTGDGSNAVYPMTVEGIRQVIIDSVGEGYLWY